MLDWLERAFAWLCLFFAVGVVWFMSKGSTDAGAEAVLVKWADTVSWVMTVTVTDLLSLAGLCLVGSIAVVAIEYAFKQLASEIRERRR